MLRVCIILHADTDVQGRFQTFGNLFTASAVAADIYGTLISSLLLTAIVLLLFVLIVGPPPTKRKREDDNGQTNTSEAVDGSMQPEMKDLAKELYNTTSDKWEDIGILLGIESGILDAIKAAENQAPQRCLREMLKLWLKRISPPPSWAAIADAVELLGDQNLADHLRTKYHVAQ